MGNAALVLVGALVNSLGILLAGSFLAVGLGPEGYGTYISSIALVTLVSFFANFGIGQLLLKKFGQLGWGAHKLLRPSIQIIVCTTSLSLCLIVSLHWLAPSITYGLYAILIMCFYLIGIVFTELMSAVYQLQEKYEKLSLLPLIPNLAKLLCYGGLLFGSYLEFNLRSVSYVFFVTLILLLAFNLQSLNDIRSRKVILTGFSDPKVMDKRDDSTFNTISILKESLPFTLTGLFHFIYFQSDLILIGYLASPTQAGVYGLAAMIVSGILLFPTVFYQRYFLFKLHRWSSYDQDMFIQVFKRGILISAFFGLIAFLLVLFLANSFIPIIFGDEYLSSVDFLEVLSVTILISYMTTALGATITVGDKSKTKAKIMCCAAITKVILNVSLIPIYGALGAAYATIMSSFLLLLMYSWASSVFIKRLSADN